MTEQEAGSDTLNIDNMYLCGSAMSRVNLSRTVFRDMVGEGMQFDDVNLSTTKITNANLTGLALSDVNLSDATIDNANLSRLAISIANLEGMTNNGVLVTDLIKAHDAKDD